ncbi:MAG: hypothetical protein V3W31_06720, partial [Thermodesulfobacteriota bacterium]
MSDTTIYILIAVFVLVNMMVTGFVIYKVRQRQKAGGAGGRGGAGGSMEEIASALEAKAEGNRITGTVRSGTGGELPYECEYSQGSKNTPSYFKVRIECSFPHPLKIRREGGFDRFGKSIGLAEEVQTGERQFDEKFYVATENRAFAGPYLMDDRRRAPIKAIFSHPVKSITFSNDSIEVLMEGVGPSDVSPEMIKDIVENLPELVGDLPETPASISISPGRRGERMSTGKLLILVLTPFILVGNAGIAAIIFGIIKYPPLETMPALIASARFALQYALPLGIPVLGAVFISVKGRHDAHTVFFSAALAALISFS